MIIALATRCMRTFVLCCLAGLCVSGVAFAQISNDTVHVDIPAQSLSSALTQFGRDTGTEIVFTPEAVNQKRSTAIKGDFAKEKALTLMLAGTGLTYRVTAQGAIVIHSTIRTLEKTSPGTSLQTVPEDSSSNDGETHNKNDLDEIRVRGTHIRGTTNSPSPVLVFTRDDIDAAGVNTIQDFLQSLPQNFGGASQNTIGAVASVGSTKGVNGS